MQTINAQAGDQLDKIVFKYYGTLEVYTKVLESNTHLVNKVLLDDGDIVNLPTIEIEKSTIKKVETLW